jgi:T5SS/PEP-CTERM-associated repeat protein
MLNRRKSLRIVLVITLVRAFSFAVPAVAKNWNTTDGNWGTAANWSPAAVPVGGEEVNIVNADGVARTVTLDVNTPSLGLVTINQTGGSAVNTLSIPNNNSFTSGALFVAGWTGGSGGTTTGGRGAVNQANGTVTMASGTDLVVGFGSGSIGTYTLSGTGALTASQSEFIGSFGNGTFTQSGGTNTLVPSAVGYLNIGYNVGGVGTYNLNGGSLVANKNEVVGDAGTGVFNQTGGTNTLAGTNSLYIANTDGSTGTYTASGTATLSVGGNVNIGVSNSGTGTLNVQGSANVDIGGTLNVWSGDHVNLSGGTLRLNGYSQNSPGVFNFTSGTLKLTGTRVVGSDAAISGILGGAPTILTGRSVVVEGGLDANANVFVTGGALQVGSGASSLRVGETANSTLNISSGGSVTAVFAFIGSVNGSTSGTLIVDGAASSFTSAFDLRIAHNTPGLMTISNGGTVTTTNNATLGEMSSGTFTVTLTGAGSKWNIGQSLAVGPSGSGTMNVGYGTLVSVGTAVGIYGTSTLTLNGGTLRFDTLTDSNNRLVFNTGTIQLAGNRIVGTDSAISHLFGPAAAVPTGKGLTVEGATTIASAATLTISGGTFKSNGLTVNSGGALDFDRGVFELTGGVITGLTNLTVPTGGEFRASGVQPVRVTGVAGSTITATGALTLGDSNAVDGFGTQGRLQVGANAVTLLDANDVVFDSLSLATLGSGASPGTLNAANGLTLDFGGNVTGFGTVSTPNNLAKPLINSGHITGNSAGQPITLPGYVKGVGTFDNVSFTGTFSPGFSPAKVDLGSAVYAGTLQIEIGGLSAGSGYDQLNHILGSGLAQLGGALDVSLINGFTPAAGERFQIITASGGISGAFGSFLLPALAAPLAWNTSQLSISGILSVFDTNFRPGDMNRNGLVDVADVSALLSALSDLSSYQATHGPGGGALTSGQLLEIADLDYDNLVTNADLQGLIVALANGGGGGSLNAVPEPTSLALLAMGSLIMVRWAGLYSAHKRWVRG